MSWKRLICGNFWKTKYLTSYYDIIICDIINIERLNIGLSYLPQPKSTTSIDPQSAPEYHSTYVI